MEEKRHLIQIDFSAEAFQALQQITTQGRCESYVEAIRFGLAMFRWFIKEIHMGNEVLVRGKDGSLERVTKIDGVDMTKLIMTSLH